MRLEAPDSDDFQPDQKSQGECECPVAGLCTRRGVRVAKIAWNLCRAGKVDLVDRGTGFIRCDNHETAVRTSARAVPKSQQGPSLQTQSSIGTMLKIAIAERFGDIAPCGDCRREILRLNLLTASQVQADRDKILQGMVDRAAKIAPKWWQRLGAKLAPWEVRRELGQILDSVLTETGPS